MTRFRILHATRVLKRRRRPLVPRRVILTLALIGAACVVRHVLGGH